MNATTTGYCKVTIFQPRYEYTCGTIQARQHSASPRTHRTGYQSQGRGPGKGITPQGGGVGVNH